MSCNTHYSNVNRSEIAIKEILVWIYFKVEMIKARKTIPNFCLEVQKSRKFRYLSK